LIVLRRVMIETDAVVERQPWRNTPVVLQIPFDIGEPVLALRTAFGF
jgi:hypothetical protein